jgi:hypothetical protein
MQDLSDADVRSEWDLTSQNFYNHFGYSDAKISCENTGDLMEELIKSSTDGILTTPLHTSGTWLETVRELEPAHNVFPILGSMYLIRAVFEKQFPVLDQLGGQKCIAMRKTVGAGK